MTTQHPMADDDAIEARRLFIPGLARLYRGGAPFAYAFMRFSTGAVLFPHGVDKVLHGSITRAAAGIAQHGLPLPLFLAAATVFAELVASACLALGLFTRLAALMIWIEMSVIILIYQWPNGYFWTNKGIEFALLWWLLCLAIFFRGGGRWSLDHLIGREF
ncbi:MAG TPA: DoxX family protein [Stellaceae bacterium]|nr:DoxX family protein [Stellaceae bacterium]